MTAICLSISLTTQASNMIRWLRRPRAQCSTRVCRSARRGAARLEQTRPCGMRPNPFQQRRRLGITQAQVAARMGITQGRVSAIEHAKPGTTELRTLAAYVEALGGRVEIIANFGDQGLAFIEPGTEAA